MLWWALEAHCGEGVTYSQQMNVALQNDAKLSPREQVLQLFEQSEIWNLPLTLLKPVLAAMLL